MAIIEERDENGNLIRTYEDKRSGLLGGGIALILGVIAALTAGLVFLVSILGAICFVYCLIGAIRSKKTSYKILTAFFFFDLVLVVLSLVIHPGYVNVGHQLLYVPNHPSARMGLLIQSLATSIGKAIQLASIVYFIVIFSSQNETEEVGGKTLIFLTLGMIYESVAGLWVDSMIKSFSGGIMGEYFEDIIEDAGSLGRPYIPYEWAVGLFSVALFLIITCISKKRNQTQSSSKRSNSLALLSFFYIPVSVISVILEVNSISVAITVFLLTASLLIFKFGPEKQEKKGKLLRRFHEKWQKRKQSPHYHILLLVYGALYLFIVTVLFLVIFVYPFAIASSSNLIKGDSFNPNKVVLVLAVVIFIIAIVRWIKDES